MHGFLILSLVLLVAVLAIHRLNGEKRGLDPKITLDAPDVTVITPANASRIYRETARSPWWRCW